MIDVYETWDESWGESGIRTTTATDAPAGVRLVKADEYDRLREAVEWYADEKQYRTITVSPDLPDSPIHQTPGVVVDGGERAREALKGDSDGDV